MQIKAVKNARLATLPRSLDFWDGRVARDRDDNQSRGVGSTYLGVLADPIVDKICDFWVLIVLLGFPLAIQALLTITCLLLATAYVGFSSYKEKFTNRIGFWRRLVWMSKTKPTEDFGKANIAGKTKTAFLVVAESLLFLKEYDLAVKLIWIAIFLGVISLIISFIQLVQFKKQKGAGS